MTGQGIRILHGDCVELMRGMDDASIDAIVTDPPYGLGFMGKAWDALPPGEEWARECLRVLKPGGYLLAFGGTRTWHRLAVAVEDAGFEIRDSIAWMHGQGFPKSLDVSKAIDATELQGGSNSRRLRATEQAGDGDPYTMTGKNNGIMGETVVVERKSWAPETDAAKAWEGWGTALKPAFEPIVVGRKPLVGTVAGNVLAYGTGALNIAATRIPGEVPSVPQPDFTKVNGVTTHLDAHARNGEMSSAPGGRWPTNVILDESQAEALDEQSGSVGANGGFNAVPTEQAIERSKGGASRFFYVAKASKKERPQGDVTHPTVKPLKLMRYLVRLVTPEGGTVLDPFAGSGTTVEACILEGFNVIGIEREADYLPLIEQRINRAANDLEGIPRGVNLDD